MPGSVRIAGYASRVEVDRGADSVLPSAWMDAKALGDYLLNPVLLFAHDHKQVIGTVEILRVVEGIGLWIEAIVNSTPETEQNILPQIRAGSLRGFSIGFKPIQARWSAALEANLITKLLLLEISCVAVPMNAHTVFNLDTMEASIERRRKLEKEDRLKCFKP